LLGYHPVSIARPYNILTITLIFGITILSWIPLYLIRNFYIDKITLMGYEQSSVYFTILAIVNASFVCLLLLICLVSIRYRIRYFIR